MNDKLNKLTKNYWMLSKERRQIVDLLVESVNSQLEEPLRTIVNSLFDDARKQAELIDLKCEMARREIDNDPEFENLIIGKTKKEG